MGVPNAFRPHAPASKTESARLYAAPSLGWIEAALATKVCIGPHIWLSPIERPEEPDQTTIDLDPSSGDFEPGEGHRAGAA
jgi:hypothetical protein